MALTSDMICLLFIPVNWLFFAASTYVWVQFVWHTGKLLVLLPVPCMLYDLVICAVCVHIYNS